MQTVAITSNGNVIGKIWYNDDDTQTSKLVNSSDIEEICGDMGAAWNWDDADLDTLNAELYGFSFTQEPKY